MKKYEMIPDGTGLYRIKSLINIPKYDVYVGDLGGRVEKETNLSHSGACWIGRNARVVDNATLREDAIADDNAYICDCAYVGGSAEISDYANVMDTAHIDGNAWVGGHATIGGRCKISDNVKIDGQVYMCGNVMVAGRVYIGVDVVLQGDIIIKRMSDIVIFKNFWSSGRYFAWTRSNNMWSVGCFYGTGEELIKKAYADSEISGREYERVVKYVESILEDEK